MSEALAHKGYIVDIIADNKEKIKRVSPRLRDISYDKFKWQHYDVIKTLFHNGFVSLCKTGGYEHPFIISKLGSVVSKKEKTGVHFYGEHRKRLYAIQRMIDYKSRYVTVLTEPSKKLWEAEFGIKNNILIVPTGVDREIPPPKRNPYKKFKEKIVVYIGNIYNKQYQSDINYKWQRRFNNLGKILRKAGIRLFLIVSGDTYILDSRYTHCIGIIENKDIWDYQYFADVGIVLAQGPQQHNESSKIYYYLRTGLPVVSESPVPNNNLISESNLGFISDYDNDRMLADLIARAAYKRWDKEKAINYILENHTWDKRAQIYDRLIMRELKYVGKEA
jgi:hypothetical protein